MSKILSRILGLLKYLLLVASFGGTLLGIIITYQRLEKDLIDAVPIFIPFGLALLSFIMSLFIKSNKIKDNLLYNFTACLVCGVILMVVLRAKFDTNMLIYYKYKIDFNPLYFADNLAAIQLMLYCLFGSNVLLIITALLDKEKKPKELVKKPEPEVVTPVVTKPVTKPTPEVEIIEESILVEEL